MRLTDYYDIAGEPGDDVIQDTSVRLVDQYNAAGVSDEVIADNTATDEIVPAPNNELQVSTAMFTTNNNSSSAETANDTLFINNIKSRSHSSTAELDPFDVRRLMSKRTPPIEVASEDGEPAPYYPVPINHPPSDGSAVPTSNKPKSKSILWMSLKKSKNKGIPSVMNAFVTILACVFVY